MRLALDTNRYVDLARGDDALQALLEQATEVWLPFVVVAELRAGFAVGSRARSNERALTAFCGKPGVGVLWPDDLTTRQYAALYRQLRSQGTPVPTSDLWIAALVAQHGLTLCTRDQHFRHLPQLALV